QLGRLRGYRTEPAPGGSVRDQGLEIRAHGAELGRADVERLAGDVRVRRAHGRVHQVLDGQQLVAVRPVAEDRNAPALADPVEQNLEDAEALRPDEGLRAKNDDLEAAAGDAACDALGLDLRL